jgi:glycolate oxidase FAD binding subunit
MSTPALEELLAAHQLGEHPALPGVPVARPEEVEQARDLFALARRDGLRMVLMGSGTKLGWSMLTARPDFALSTTGLSGITDFEPGDGTLTARAGTTMAELQRTAHAAGLHVTPDVPRSGEATLGGTIGAGASGADRLQLGPSRQHVLGTRALQLDGEVTRSGGNLVKNVTGYDLQRLYCGSFGSLALVVEASLRLFPNPAMTAVASMSYADLELALECASAVMAAQVSPRAVTITSGEGTAHFQLDVVFAGLAEHVQLELERIAPTLEEPRITRGEEADALRNRLREREPDARVAPFLHIVARPSRLRATAGDLFEILGHHSKSQLLVQPGVATIDLAPFSTGDDEQQVELLQRIQEALIPHGAQATLRAGAPLPPAFARPSSDPLRTSLTERLRNSYDPQSLLCTRPVQGGTR